MRPLQAHCHRGLGTLYATIGQQEQARAELSAAIVLYRAMDMTLGSSCKRNREDQLALDTRGIIEPPGLVELVQTGVGLPSRE